ncbi:TonB family protein [Hymenobacter antarcticus]|uniref:TonB C-terminal domain-containing protein n=1 Tax=Hymenobacter antarcticus TaxID=486270 RepID=A0ABP7Q0P2_9BACT
MLLLPTFNAALQPCPVSPAAFEAHEKGHFCGSCQRVVQDFSQSPNPVADLAAARAAAPDGRVCGSFRRTQTMAPPPLTRRLRWFLLALVLVLGQGLTAHEALAQVRQPAQKQQKPLASRRRAPLPPDENPNRVYGSIMEMMPVFQGGGNRELIQYIQQQVIWPQENGKIVLAEGRLFVSFSVGSDGLVRNAEILKSFNSRFDEAVLQVVRALPPFEPGLQNGLPVSVSMTLPITFKLK